MSEMPECNQKGVNLMIVAIFVVLLIIMIMSILAILMMAAITADVAKLNKPKSYEEAQTQLFKAWGDSVEKEYKKS